MLSDEGKQMRKNPIYFSRNVRFHSENIENLVPRPPDPLPPKPPRWVCADCCQRKTNAAMCALHLPLLVIVVVVVMVKRFHLISVSMTCHYKWTSDQWMTSRSVAKKNCSHPGLNRSSTPPCGKSGRAGETTIFQWERLRLLWAFFFLWKLKSLINDNDIMEYNQQPVGATRALFAKAHWRRGRRSDSGKICKNLQWVFIFWSSLLPSSWCREFTLLGQRKEEIIVFSSFRLMHEPSFASKNAVIYEKTFDHQNYKTQTVSYSRG